MSDSKVLGWSMVIGGEVAAGSAKLLVEPQHRGQGEQPLGDPDPDPGHGPATVCFQAELAFEGIDDALDTLADCAQVAVPGGFIAAVGPDEDGVQLADLTGELG